MTAFELLRAASGAPAGSTTFAMLNNIEGGGGGVIQVFGVTQVDLSPEYEAEIQDTLESTLSESLDSELGTALSAELDDDIDL